MIVKVLLDTNFLILMAKGLVTPSMLESAIPALYELETTSAVVSELDEMSSRRDLLSRYAAAAKELLGKLKVRVVPTDEHDGDSSLLKYSQQLKARNYTVVVATVDSELRKALKKAGIPTLYLKGRKRALSIDWSPVDL